VLLAADQSMVYIDTKAWQSKTEGQVEGEAEGEFKANSKHVQGKFELS
jgi:hypothetical protein